MRLEGPKIFFDKIDESVEQSRSPSVKEDNSNSENTELPLKTVPLVFTGFLIQCGRLISSARQRQLDGHAGKCGGLTSPPHKKFRNRIKSLELIAS